MRTYVEKDRGEIGLIRQQYPATWLDPIKIISSDQRLENDIDISIKSKDDKI